MQYLREISRRVEDLSSQFPVLILTGARQTGKTTLLKALFPGYNYITLDLPSDAEMAENDPENFLKMNSAPLIIDEAQYAPKIFRHLKLVVDQSRDKPGQYILTGSQKFNLMKEVSDSLAGRCAWLELESLSLREISQEQSLREFKLEAIHSFITRGFLPELWNRLNLDHREYYRSYLATYLERDVRQILNISSLRDFERFVRVCAARNAQLLNKTEVAKDVGVSLNTVTQWISLLEASNQITLVEPYFQNVGKRVIKSPKIYFNEIGMLSFLLNINVGNISDSPFLGTLWETLIFTEFNKLIKNKLPDANLWFYRDNRGNEVDFILEHNNQLDFFEVKWTQEPQERSLMALHKVHELFKDAKLKHISIGSSFILCRTPKKYIKKEICIQNLEYFTDIEE